MKVKLNGVLADGSSPVTTVEAAQPFNVPQGTDVTVELTVKNSAGAAVDVTGYTAILTVRKTTTATTLFSRAGTIVDGPTGRINFALVRVDTLSKTPGDYLYDIWIISAINKGDRVVPASTFDIVAAVTKLDESPSEAGMNAGSVTTTNATAATVGSFVPGDNSAVFVEFKVIGRNATGLEAAGFWVRGVFFRSGGTVTQVGVTTSVDIDGSLPWIADMDISGTYIRIRVTGEAGKTINWHCSGTYTAVM